MAKVARARTLYFLIAINILLALGLAFTISSYLSLRADLEDSIRNQQARCEILNTTVRPQLHLPQVDCKATYPLP